MSDNRQGDSFLAMQCGSQCGLPPLMNKGEIVVALLNVRFWHKADITAVLIHVRFRGVKRTFLELTSMSAFDPKRT